MKIITALRRRGPMRVVALLRGIALLVIVMAGLGMNLFSSALPAKAQGEDLTGYPAQGPNNGTNPLNYNGGPVITNPQAYLIFEGSYWGQSYSGSQTNMQRVQQYFTDVSGSNFEGILTQYYDTDTSGTKHYISKTISVAGAVLDTNFQYSNECTTANVLYDSGSTASPNDMADEITKEITANHWTNTTSTIFFVFTPTDYALILGSCVRGGLPGLGGGLECAYHETVGSYNYAAMNWGYQGSSQVVGCSTDGNPTDTLINEASHEQFEAITEPQGSFYSVGNGWKNGDCSSFLWITGCEIGDKCESSQLSGFDVHQTIYLNGNSYPGVQGEFSNATGDCEYTIAPAYPVVDVPGGGAFRTLWLSTGDVTGPLGAPIDSWYSIPGGQKQDFGGGSIYWSSATGTAEVQGAIYNEYVYTQGGPGGVLGFPTTNEQGIANGRVSYFYGNLCGARGPNNSGAAIYYSGTTGAHQVGGCIYNHYWRLGEANSQLNFPTSDVLAISNGYVSYFYGVRCGGVANGPDNSGSAIYDSAAGDFYVQGCVYAKYQQLGATTSALGFPVSDENTLYDSNRNTIGWVSYFAGVRCGSTNPYGSGSAIYVPASNNSASGGHEVQGCVFATYQRLGGPSGLLGFPVSDENTLYNSSGSTIGWASYFQGTSCGSGGGGGGVFVPASHNTTSGGFEVHGCIYQEYMAVQGGPTGVLGFPTSDEQSIAGGRVSYFSGNLCGAPNPANNSGSAIYHYGPNTHQVGGCIYNKYWQMGEANSFLGFPVSDVTAIPNGYVSYFAGELCNGSGPDGSGSAIYSSASGTHEVQGCIYNKYWHDLGGPAGCLGFPTTDEYTADSALDRESDFQHGFIFWQRSNGAISWACA